MDVVGRAGTERGHVGKGGRLGKRALPPERQRAVGPRTRVNAAHGLFPCHDRTARTRTCLAVDSSVDNLIRLWTTDVSAITSV